MSPEPLPGVLLLYHRPTPLFHRDAATVMEHVSAFARHSDFPVWQLNTEHGLPPALWKLRFRSVVLHYSLFATVGYHLNFAFRSYLQDRCGDSVKIAFFQDEFHFCQNRFAFLNEYDIDCVYSCLEPQFLGAVYGRYTRVPILRSNIPGYVSQRMVDSAATFALSDADRRVDVGYRGRPLPPYVGRGGMEKYEIGVRFRKHAACTGLRLDIATGEGDRIYGDDWYRFVTRCRAVLGVESGVSMFDLEDEVYTEYRSLVEAGEEVTVERLEHGALGRWQQIPYRTISPRHFEAAALRTCQILYPGNYSGAMEPMVHYIPLEKDFSNFGEVLERFRDEGLRARLVANCRRDLIESGDYSYAAFIAGFDQTLRDAGLEPGDSTELAWVRPALASGAWTRQVRAQTHDLVERGRAREFPGKFILRVLLTPLLRLLDASRAARR